MASSRAILVPSVGTAAFKFSPVKRVASLKAWTCGKTVARCAYKLTLDDPLRRHFGLADQIRRAAAAIPANIAEGYALATTPQFVRCLRIALGSATELLTHLELVQDQSLAAVQPVEQSLRMCDEEIGILIGLIRKLQARSSRTLPSSRFPLPR